jgi:hypothetical protein
MPDPAEQLARIYQAGFEIRQWDAYPGMAAVVRGECVALLKPGPDGLSIVGSPGWVIGERLGVKTQRDGRWVFQSKATVIEATPERLSGLASFHEDLAGHLQVEH